MIETTSNNIGAYSTHLFAWSFTVKTKDISRFWKKKGWHKVNLAAGKFRSERKNMDCYMLNQYLSVSARDIFMLGEKSVCNIYEYPMEEGAEYSYEIKVSEGQIYSLPIISIELHFYNFGVGILFLQMLNKTYEQIEDIKKINDLGRRISIPFIPDEVNGYIICAESIGIRKKTKEHVREEVTDFRDKIKKYAEKSLTFNELAKSADFLHGLLNCRLEKNEEEDEEIIVQPNADDRMFLISLIRNDTLSDEIKLKKFETNDEFQKLLYSILYADPTDATCQEKKMREELLERAGYLRWCEYGSYYGVTSYSLLCITSASEDINAAVVRPFLIEYSYLLSMVLAQRIAIAGFSKKAGEIASKIDQRGKIKREQARDLVNLQKDYITFKSQMLVLEASTQEQGNEIYNLMQKQLMVSDERQNLDSQLEGLYEVVNVSSGNRIETWGLGLAIAAIAIDVCLTIFYRS